MSLLKQYDHFLLTNASQITGVESTLRSITYFLPGRFKDAELAGEAIYSALNLLGLYHDSILVRALSQQHTAAPGTLPSSSSSPSSASSSPSSFSLSEHARYTQHFSRTSTPYNLVARALVIIGYLELLVEMAARRKLSKRRAWDVVATIEATKAALRLSLIHMTGDRMSIQPPIPEREVDPATLEEERTKRIATLATSLDKAAAAAAAEKNSSAASPPTASSSAAPSGYWKGIRTGYLRPTLASLRPGSLAGQQDDAAQGEKGKGPHNPAPPHLRALGMAGHNSGSDSDDTLVAQGTASMSSSRTLPPHQSSTGSGALKHGPPSPPAPLEPWTEKQINDYLLSRVVSVNDVRRPEDLVRPLRNRLAKAAETLWVLRPLLYVLAIRRWGRRHTAPFLLSFCLEYIARAMRKRALSSSTASGNGSAASLLGNPLVAAMMGGNPMLGLLSAFLGGDSAAAKEKRPISSVEEMEWSKRDRSFWWYLLRGPVWYGWTRPKLSSLVARTENRALIGMVGGIVGDYLPLVDEYYFYSAT
ncbi:uncharacterized protein PFL1_03023 [Pseudozyma flocculosa PF-1]|uniref:Peroxisomal membrane protein PEX16 n=2 Tax=Pseudozyma flocculosa TaxID=84751 RepID=A0A5C3F0H6_9BASI|nr:uncharacterized protein PFL1_03023 [Pseudozyma flocculosa PF-1]EPQ29268.1 hypothetical protein PFL1_03023 [Pseudozyma flocculosa PF-1]SPO37772.1 related to Peroxisomal membrane protein PEX16 [Pseudozyma flocculosa]